MKASLVTGGFDGMFTKPGDVISAAFTICRNNLLDIFAKMGAERRISKFDP